VIDCGIDTENPLGTAALRRNVDEPQLMSLFIT
jgi:hypothetical protein